MNNSPLTIARVTKGLTQTQLAKKLGVEQSTISQWERNINRMSFGDLRRVCAVLGIKDLNTLCEGVKIS